MTRRDATAQFVRHGTARRGAARRLNVLKTNMRSYVLCIFDRAVGSPLLDGDGDGGGGRGDSTRRLGAFSRLDFRPDYVKWTDRVADSVFFLLRM